jgi:hypothetical protein
MSIPLLRLNEWGRMEEGVLETFASLILKRGVNYNHK